MGNVIKYISRAGLKTPDKLLDLEKALNYINDEIKKGNKTLNFEPTDTFISGYEYIRSQHHLDSTLQNVISQDQIKALVAFAQNYQNTSAIDSKQVLEQLNSLSKSVSEKINSLVEQAKNEGWLDKIAQFFQSIFDAIKNLFSQN